MYARFANGASFREAFRKRFNLDITDESINQSHQIVIVASQIDPASERIIRYLSERAIPINALFFQVFEGPNGEKLLSRAWLIDPAETQLNSSTANTAVKEPWNGEYYVSFGSGAEKLGRGSKYGFISAGGGEWYTRTLKGLNVGDGIWVNVPATGYVAVGRVTGPASSLSEFLVEESDGEHKAVDVLAGGHYHKEFIDDPEMTEYFVPVHWLDSVPVSKAVSEAGLFGNQNTVCQPRSQKWRHTIDQLKHRFPHWDDAAWDSGVGQVV